MFRKSKYWEKGLTLKAISDTTQQWQHCALKACDSHNNSKKCCCCGWKAHNLTNNQSSEAYCHCPLKTVYLLIWRLTEFFFSFFFLPCVSKISIHYLKNVPFHGFSTNIHVQGVYRDPKIWEKTILYIFYCSTSQPFELIKKSTIQQSKKSKKKIY